MDENVMWAGGQNGVYIFTTDGGEKRTIDSVPGAGTLDFRSVWAFNGDTVILVSAGTPARIFKTTDGGKNWKITFSSDNPSIFLNAISFWDAMQGIVMGDPYGGHLFILKTKDAGENWERIPVAQIPRALTAEGGFAASGTCLRTLPPVFAWIGTGGDSARVYRTEDKGLTWKVVNTPVLSGSQMKGIYSVSFKNAMQGIVVGGEWNAPSPPDSKAYSWDGGKTWTLAEGPAVYCSGSCYVKNDIFLACGQSGIFLSADLGKTWTRISEEHLYGLDFDDKGKTGYATGPGGKLVRLQLVETNTAGQN
ncbi:MAG: WD40/YVTN/BNR-like repeat-containing protein [Bacteroidales bacterium]